MEAGEGVERGTVEGGKAWWKGRGREKRMGRGIEERARGGLRWRLKLGEERESVEEFEGVVGEGGGSGGKMRGWVERSGGERRCVDCRGNGWRGGI